MRVLKEINDTSVIARQKIERNMLSFRNALSLMILTRTRDSNVMRNALELAQSKILFEYRLRWKIGIPKTNAELRLYRIEIHLTKWKFKI